MLIDIEDLLVWTYRNQRADVVIERGLGLHAVEATMDRVELQGRSTCGCASVEAIQQLGVRVDGTGGCDALHEDAETVHRVVMLLPRPMQLLVIRHAKDRDRPDVMAGIVPRPIYDLNRKGRAVVRHEPWDKSHNYGWCPIRWTVSLVAIDAARLEYSHWLHCLDRVGATLRLGRRLTKHIVVGPKAPLKPWEHGIGGASI